MPSVFDALTEKGAEPRRIWETRWQAALTSTPASGKDSVVGGGGGGVKPWLKERHPLPSIGWYPPAQAKSLSATSMQRV